MVFWSAHVGLDPFLLLLAVSKKQIANKRGETERRRDAWMERWRDREKMTSANLVL